MTNESELNKKLHEARGLCWHKIEYIGASPWCTDCGQRYGGLAYYKHPSYTESVSDAFELLEWCRKEKGWQISIGELDGHWLVCWWKDGDGVMRLASGEHDSLPTAISLSAARALGIQEG